MHAAFLLVATAALAAASDPQDSWLLEVKRDRDYRDFTVEVAQTAPDPADHGRQRAFVDWYVGDDRGSLRRIVWREWNSRVDPPGAAGNLVLVETFDAESRLVDEERWFFGDLARRVTYTRDAEGRVLEQVEERVWRARTGRTEYVYGDSGELRASVWSLHEGGDWSPTARSDFEYDEAGRLRLARRSQVGEVVDEQAADEYRYTSRGLLESKTVRSADGATISCLEYEYDADGRLAGMVDDLPSGWMKRRFIDDDRDGRPERQVLQVRGESGRIESSLDREGRTARALVVDAEGRPMARTDLEYDDQGYVICEELRDAGGRLVEQTTRAFTCDARGNVVAIIERQEQFADGAGGTVGSVWTRTLSREIEYAPSADRR